MSRQRVLITDIAWPDAHIEKSILADAGIEGILAPDGSEATLTALAKDADGIITCFAPVTRTVITAGSRLRVIARTGVGLDNIDVATAAELGITVTRVPDYCVDEVSQHATALAMMLLRRIPQYAASVRHGHWGVRPDLPIRRIAGARAMVLGRGLMGNAVGAKLQALGMELVDKPDGADLLTIHVPLKAETHHLVDDDYLRRLAPGGVVVNTSRGGVLDHAAALAAIDDGRLSGLGVDVLPHEPPPLGDPLLHRDNVIVTPHVAFYSEESLLELRTRAARSVVNILRGASE